MRSALVLLILTIFGSGCANVAKRSEITDLNRVYRIRANQMFFAKDAQGKISAKLLNHPANAALYQREDTLFAEFVPASLHMSDNNPKTVDQSDSLALLFLHYNRKLDYIEEKSPWFYYQLTSFDIDLFTMPFKYRFPTAGRPGQLATGANFGAYFGVRYDLGRYRNIYYRRERRSDIQSFSFGVGALVSLDPVLVNEYNTLGRVPYEYDALGLNYGLAAIFGYKRVTAGLALGFENLADANNRLWIHRQKPWLGLTVGINLN